MLENKAQLKSGADLYSLLKTDVENLASFPNITDEAVKKTLCNLVWEKVKKPEQQTTTVCGEYPFIYVKATGPPAVIPVSMGKLNNAFKKEIGKRKRGAPELTAEILACTPHNFFHDHSHGERCQICDFETTKEIWCCRRHCGVSLCGSCAFKWKNKC